MSAPGVLIKLNDARAQFHSRQLRKTGRNEFAGYDYFELSDFLAPALEIFGGLKLSGIVSFGAELATMTLTDLEDGSQFCITSPMSTAKLKACHEVQNLGAVQTYLRRYLWVAALEIVEHDALNSTQGRNGSLVTAADVNNSISVLHSAKTLDALTAFFKVEVAKFDPKGDDYKRLKAAASTRKAELQEVAA